MPIRPDLRHHYAGPEWAAIRAGILRRANGRCEHCGARAGDVMPSGGRLITVQLGVAHLDHDPSNNADDNLKALCRGCHLRHDKGQHKLTRCLRKDARRPLLAMGAKQ